MKRFINILIIIVTVILLMIIYYQNKRINEIINTKYEFCYTTNGQEICGQQKIKDYLNGLD